MIILTLLFAKGARGWSAFIIASSFLAQLGSERPPHSATSASCYLFQYRSPSTCEILFNVPKFGFQDRSFWIVRRCLLHVLLLMSLVPDLSAYSVLTHEAIIDATWQRDIEPLLLSRYPHATPGQLLRAHAYAYGGAIYLEWDQTEYRAAPPKLLE